MQLGSLPRLRLAHLPTPLEELPNLTKKLGGPTILVKRDDLTGLGFGGNKTRKLEYIMADAKTRETDVIITGAGFHSNWCTQTACAAKKLGMDIILIKQGPEEDYDPPEYDGNHLLHVILGSGIKVITSPRLTDKVAQDLADALQQEGKKPYIISFAGSNPLGVAGYVNAILEIIIQAIQRGIKIDYIIHATGSGGTQAGLILGAKAFNTGINVLGVSASKSENRADNIFTLLTNSARFLDVDCSLTRKDVTVFNDYTGEGYGILNRDVVEATILLAETEGFFLDPVYSGKAMAGLIDLIKNQYFNVEDNVVFLHTGGTAALFPYKNPLKAFIKGEELPWTKPSWSP